MKDGRGEVLFMRLDAETGDMHMMVKGREDAEWVAATLRAMAPPTATVEIVSDTLVVGRGIGPPVRWA
jgi:hypothetical protein